jgi:pre-mRNA-processing factor 8
MAISGAVPSSKLLYRDIFEEDEDWNEFNDINKIIIRNHDQNRVQNCLSHICTTARPRRVAIIPYHYPAVMYIKQDDPEYTLLSTFDPSY